MIDKAIGLESGTKYSQVSTDVHTVFLRNERHREIWKTIYQL
jgi:hypothetical protein